MAFAEQLKMIMEKENLTQKEVTIICHVNRATLSRYLSGKRTPSYETASQMMKALGYDIGVLEKRSGNKDKKLRKNGSGYSDPTAYMAIKKADAERDRMMKLLDLIFTIAEYAGFHVEERIVLKDKKTGKIWR